MSTAVKLSKLLITEYRGKLFAISYDGDRANEIEYIENDSLLGSIHIGRVKKISKNINAAFVEIEYNRERQIVYFDMNDFKYLIPFELAPPVVKSAQPIGANADLTPISIVLP